MGIKVKGAPAVASWKEGRLDVFVRSMDDHLYHRVYENDKWQGTKWEELSNGHKLEQSPSAVSWGSSRIDLFAVWDQKTHHRACVNGSWNSWTEELGGATNDAPAAASWKMERVDVLVYTTDNNMSRRYWENGTTSRMGNGWKDWENVGGQSEVLNSAPTAVSSESGRIDCFARGKSGHLQDAWYKADTSDVWKEIDNIAIKDAPAAVSGSSADHGRVDVFVRGGADDLLKHRVYYAEQQAGQTGSDEFYIAQAGDRLSKIARDHKISLQTLENLNPNIKNPNLIHPGDKIIIAHHVAVPGYGGWQTGSTWDDVSANKIFSVPAAVASWNSNVLKRIDCFAQGADNHLTHTWWK